MREKTSLRPRVLTSLVVLIAACGIIVTSGAAVADPGNGNGATVVRFESGQCSVGSPAGHWQSNQCDIQYVTAPDGTENIHGSGPIDPAASSPLPDHAVTIEGTLSGGTFHATVTPSGRLTAEVHCTSTCV